MKGRKIVLWRWRLWAKAPLIAWLIVVVAVAFGFYQLERQQDRIEAVGVQRAKDQKERLHQTCTLFESTHLDDVREYGATIKYLQNLSDEEAKSSINRAVLLNLPKTRRKAQTDTAPAFCDRPNRGLPEPDPVVPDDPFVKP